MALLVPPAHYLTRDVIELDPETGLEVRDWPKIRSKGMVRL